MACEACRSDRGLHTGRQPDSYGLSECEQSHYPDDAEHAYTELTKFEFVEFQLI